MDNDVDCHYQVLGGTIVVGLPHLKQFYVSHNFCMIFSISVEFQSGKCSFEKG